MKTQGFPFTTPIRDQFAGFLADMPANEQAILKANTDAMLDHVQDFLFSTFGERCDKDNPQEQLPACRGADCINCKAWLQYDCLEATVLGIDFVCE